MRGWEGGGYPPFTKGAHGVLVLCPPGPLRRPPPPPSAAAGAHPSPAAGSARAGSGGARKDLCVAGTHPLVSETASAPRPAGPHRGCRPGPRLRKGRAGEPPWAPGTARGSGGVSAPRPAAPLPPRRRPRPSRFGKPAAAGRAREGSAGQGRPLAPGMGRCCPPAGGRPGGRNLLPPRSWGRATPGPGEAGVSEGQEGSIPGVMPKRGSPRRGPREPSLQVPWLRCCPPALL